MLNFHFFQAMSGLAPFGIRLPIHLIIDIYFFFPVTTFKYHRARNGKGTPETNSETKTSKGEK